MPRPQELAFTALQLQGGLLAADFLNKVARLEASEQTEADYDVPRGLKLRDEIGRYWNIAQSLWQDFAARRARADLDPHAVSVHEFLVPFCRQVLGFTDLKAAGQITLDERVFPIGHAAGEGRVPLVFAAHDLPLDKPDARHGDGVRRRSPFLLAQEYLNASHASLWAVVSNGLKFRILRDNASFTRPAYIEADLEVLFSEGLYPDFAALWLLAHASRFSPTPPRGEGRGEGTPSPLRGEGRGGGETSPADCPLERWRNTAQEDGIRARDRLREGVAEALRALGSGFLAHPGNAALRQKLEAGKLTTQAYFEQLLRLVYRFIFLATIEDRELVHTPEAAVDARERYHAGYSLARLRRLAARRRSYDRHSDLWQALTITFAGLGQGQPALGLPALGGLFDARQCPDLDTASLDNQALLTALFSLCFFREGAALSRVNYRDMDSEELGSVYESLLELVPQLTAASRSFGFVGDRDISLSPGGERARGEGDTTTKGNARKLTGSYYTPDSLVRELIESALDPVIRQTLAENPGNPVRALLNLTVCDPACGSGHFLLAAARRLAEEVAKLRAPDANPLPADYRHALRDVVAHCIHGVDKNPLAVELARTALWLEAYTPDAPLTFLDHHIRCGDALLGVLDPAILEAGIPDKAFDALSGDDKAVVKALKKANREARKAIAQSRDHATFSHALDLEPEQDGSDLEALPDDSLAAIDAKRAAFARQQEALTHSRARLAADLYVAAFVMPKTAVTQTLVPTSQDLWLVLNGGQPRPGVVAAAQTAALEAQAFHWWQAFPRVLANGGFSVLLGNPPWERIKLQEEEFFASRSPLVAEAPHKAERGLRIELLRAGRLLHTLYPEVEAAQGLSPPNVAEQRLYADFLVAKRAAEAASLYAHDSGRYPLTGVGDVNTYALFAETFAELVAPPEGGGPDVGRVSPQGVTRQPGGDGEMSGYAALTRPTGGGRAGFIVPTGIATDDSTKAFFEAVTQKGRLASLYDIENREKLFPAVDSRMKFCLLTLGAAPAAEFVCFATQVGQLYDPRRRFTLSPEEFRLINPNTRTCPVFRSQRDAELTKKLYRAAPPLVLDGSATGNAWGLRFHTRLFHMAEDSHLFATQPTPELLPLYEAKFIHLFDHRWSTYDEDGATRDLTNTEKSDPAFTVTPRYWVNAAEVDSRLTAKDWNRGWLMGWRDITNATNERTVIAAVVPRVATGDTLLLMFPDPAHGVKVACLLADQCSLVHDYVARQKVGGTHLKYHVKKQLPNLPPTRYTPADLDFIVPRVLELTYTAHDLQPWAADLGFEGPPFPWNPDRRAQLRAELDAYYARLYGLSRDELRYILDPADVMGEDYPSETFRVLKNNELRQHGEYRTRRLVLEAWDRQNNQ